MKKLFSHVQSELFVLWSEKHHITFPNTSFAAGNNQEEQLKHDTTSNNAIPWIATLVLRKIYPVIFRFVSVSGDGSAAQ